MYFKDQYPLNVSSVRPPLVPDGFYGADDEETQTQSWLTFLMKPMTIGGIILLIILLWWMFGGKKESYRRQY
jgi:hypothetical protein